MEQAHGTHSIADLCDAFAGRYTVLRQVGAGGMGEVYLATDLRHERQVALKIMRPDREASHAADRFLREVSIAGKLSHPNIVPLYDSGQIGSLLFYVMPYVEGESLRDRMTREVQLSVSEALQITFGVADALEYAHGRGIVHRDVKPENIILQSGVPLVTDFGIAKAIEATGSDKLTSGRAAIGTLAYMSPEQASAEGKLDQRSDLYSLALVLYEMLAGDVPFAAATPGGMFARKAIGRYSPLRDARGAVPQYVDEAVARALQPVPADRFGSVAEFTTALRGSHVHTARRRTRILGWTLVSVASLAVLATAVSLARNGSPSPKASAPTPVAGLGRVVVAPLENRTGVPSLNIVGLMAGDWITEGLQKTGIVEVVPTTAALQATDNLKRDASNSGNVDPMRTLAAETGASTVVSGAVYRQADRLLFRVNVADRGGSRLIGTITDVFTPVSDPVSGVEELRNRLMGWLAIQYDERLKLPATSADRPPTYAAYGAFSEGMTHYIAVENSLALPLFLEAFTLDSSFTTALLYASLSLTNLGAWPRADSLLQTVNTRRQNLSGYNRAWLDYRLAFIHGNHEGALVAIREAARLAPESKAAYNHALQAFYGGHFREALSAVTSVPSDRGPMRGFAPYWDLYGTILHALRLYDREQEIGRKSRHAYPDRLLLFRSLCRGLAATGQLDSLARTIGEAEGVPTDPNGWDYGLLLTEVADELRAHGNPAAATMYFENVRQWLVANPRPRSKWRLVKTLYSLGRWDDARAQLVELRRSDSGNLEYLGMTGLLYSRTGQRDLAELVADSLASKRQPYHFGARNLYRARIAATLGQREVAMRRLREALSEDGIYDLTLHRDIDFESLRGHAQYEQLIRGRD